MLTAYLDTATLGPQVDAIRTGTALVLECRKQRRYDEVVMNASAKLLKVVPEVRGSAAWSRSPPSKICPRCISLHPPSMSPARAMPL